MFSNYRYSKHAKDQMLDRSITRAEIDECLEKQDIQHTDKKGNPVYRTKLASDRGIKVVVASDDPEFIITVADY